MKEIFTKVKKKGNTKEQKSIKQKKNTTTLFMKNKEIKSQLFLKIEKTGKLVGKLKKKKKKDDTNCQISVMKGKISVQILQIIKIQ